jgi:hypothetical protein
MLTTVTVRIVELPYRQAWTMLLILPLSSVATPPVNECPTDRVGGDERDRETKIKEQHKQP